MNTSLIKQLVLKDWNFNKQALFVYGLIGLAALVLFSINNKSAFYVGSILLVSAMVTVGIHLVIGTVVYERKEQTLPFIMSLPVSFMEYTTAKIIANLFSFLLLWICFLLAVVAVIYFREGLANGLIPFVVINILELFVAYVLILAIAIITESEGWTIVFITISNVSISLFWFFISGIEEVSNYFTSAIAVWNATSIGIVLIELLIIVLLIACMFYFQAKKKDFL